MIDYHMHLEQGPLSLDWLEKFWIQGQSCGLTEIGITEHAHQFKEFLPVYEHLLEDPRQDPEVRKWLGRHFKYSMAEYLELLEAGRKTGIPLKFGLEADYFPITEERIGNLLGQYDFDFVLGSVHFIDYWSFDFDLQVGWPQRDIDEVYTRYLSLMQQLVHSRLFDVLAHLDVIKVFGHRAQQSLGTEWRSLLHSIAQADVAIEVSTAGFRKPVGEIYPAEPLLREAARLDIPITIASDAHTPGDVGHRWPEAIAYARTAGYEHYCSFKGRKRIRHELPYLSF
jgi:histidinol-phosphatase (PHP family)